MLFLCRSDKFIYSILTILGHTGVTYASLYSILDCLSGAGLSSDEVVKLAGVSKTELGRFTATANHFGVLGVQARHGNLNWKIPKQPPLPLDESATLILTAAQKFLFERVETGFASIWSAVEGP